MIARRPAAPSAKAIPGMRRIRAASTSISLATLEKVRRLRRAAASISDRASSGMRRLVGAARPGAAARSRVVLMVVHTLHDPEAVRGPLSSSGFLDLHAAAVLRRGEDVVVDDAGTVA